MAWSKICAGLVATRHSLSGKLLLVLLWESRHAGVKGYLVLGWGGFYMGGSSILEDASQLMKALCTCFADLPAHCLIA